VRLFVAIDLPPQIRSALAEFVKQLHAIAPQAKWVRTENLHVTLKFLGWADEVKLPALENMLNTVRSANPVSLEFRGLGFFPNQQRPRVFWVAMQSSANLQTIAADIDHAAHKLGFPLDDRPFTPHLTLARFEPPRMPPKLTSAAAENASRDFGSFSTAEFRLIESRLKPAGAEYTTLRSFPFVAET
jgi:2'-5' RNA ligase